MDEKIKAEQDGEHKLERFEAISRVPSQEARPSSLTTNKSRQNRLAISTMKFLVMVASL